jgi:radical SAM/Cys-rich protein
MNRFETSLGGNQGLQNIDIARVQVNLGLLCNQACKHCHVQAGPERTERMAWATMELVLKATARIGAPRVDLTGGAPEMHPDFRRFVETLRAADHPVQVRTNLTALLEPGMEDLPDFFRTHQVQLVASMPCYLEENVRAQRGAGVYEKSLEAMGRLNAVGYGRAPDLPLDLVYNPGGPFLPPEQAALEQDYRRVLADEHGVCFTRLLTITNMPIGRFLEGLRSAGEERRYAQLLHDAFNPATVDALMCRHQISIGWDGTLFDCDFNLSLNLAVNHGAPTRIQDFDTGALVGRRIVKDDHCFGCTAGHGSSCGGALA